MMFDINESQRRARQRLGRASRRRRRSDAGRSRLPDNVLAELRAAALGHDRPSMMALQRRISDVCASVGLRPPARASLYNAFARIEGHTYSMAQLPPPVVEALYNLALDGTVPGHQLAFYCLNHGSLAAMSYAAGLPWLDLYQARHVRGWRPRSRGLLTAVMRARGIR
jgi:hypothetical protein